MNTQDRSFLAACLRKRRAELELSREAAAVQMATSWETLRKWENGQSPQVGSYPAIIAFLGYRPWPEPRGLAARLRCERQARGLPIQEAARVLAVDASTFWWWETGRKPHRIEDRRKIEVFLGEPITTPPTPAAVMEEPTKSVGRLIRDRRQELGLSQAQAATQIGANSWTLLSWENEKRRPTDRFYPAIIRFLGREPWPQPEDVKLQDGTVLRAGYKGVGEVLDAEKSGFLGKTGKLAVRLNYLRVGDQRIRIRATRNTQGEHNTAVQVGALLLLWPALPFISGHSTELKKGTMITGFVDEDTVLPVPLLPPPRDD